MLLPIFPGHSTAERRWRLRLRVRRVRRCDVNDFLRLTLPDLVSFMRLTTPFFVFCFVIAGPGERAQEVSERATHEQDLRQQKDLAAVSAKAIPTIPRRPATPTPR